jgi:hypothetical protein
MNSNELTIVKQAPFGAMHAESQTLHRRWLFAKGSSSEIVSYIWRVAHESSGNEPWLSADVPTVAVKLRGSNAAS